MQRQRCWCEKKKENLNLPLVHLHFHSHLCWFLGCLTGRLQWEYWIKGLFYPASQVSHPGKGDLGGGEAAWLQALIPGFYDRASGWKIWRSSSTGLFPLSWHPLGCISHISNTRCIHTVAKKIQVLFSQSLYTPVIKKEHFVWESCKVSWKTISCAVDWFWAHISCLGYLCWVHIIEHHYGCAVVVQY